MPQTNILNSGEVAALFSVSISTVQRWADDGKLAHFTTPGGHLRFRREDIEPLLATEAERAEATS